MNILSWIGQKLRLTDGSYWSAYYAGDTYTGKQVSAEAAMQQAAFWACVRLISQTIGTLPLNVYRVNDDGGRDQVTDHQLYPILHDMPNADQTAVEFWEGVAASICIWGNSYSRKLESKGGLIGLQPMATQATTLYRKQDGSLWYRYNDGKKQIELPDSEVFHVRGFGLGGDAGLSPLSFARQTIGLSMATEEAAARTFSNGMRPSGFFTVDKLLNPEQRAQAKKVLIDPYVGSEATGKVGILEAGFKWQDVNMAPEDAQMLQSRAFNVEEICRWFGVPPVLVGHASAGQTMWGSGVEQIMLGWLTLGLRAYLKRIEGSIKRSLISVDDRKTIYAEFQVDGLLRADTAGRANFMSMCAQNGIRTRNELRALENLPKVDGGDDLTVQSNLLPIQKLGGANPQPANATAAPPTPLRVVK